MDMAGVGMRYHTYLTFAVYEYRSTGMLFIGFPLRFIVNGERFEYYHGS